MDMSNWSAHPHDHTFIAEQLRQLPRAFRGHIRKSYNATYRDSGRREANLSVLRLGESLKDNTVRLASDDEAIRKKAASEAKACHGIAGRAQSEAQAIKRLQDYISHYGVGLPEARTAAGIIARY